MRYIIDQFNVAVLCAESSLQGKLANALKT